MDDRARLFDDRHLRRIDRSARTANRTSRKNDPTRWSMASVARRGRSNMIVSTITARRELSVPGDTLIAPRGALIVRRATVIQLFAESIVLWPKRNTHRVGCDPTPRWCECHLAVDRGHRHADYRQSAGTNRHLARKLSTQRWQTLPPCVVEAYRNREQTNLALVSVNDCDAVLNYQAKRQARVGRSATRPR